MSPTLDTGPWTRSRGARRKGWSVQSSPGLVACTSRTGGSPVPTQSFPLLATERPGLARLVTVMARSSARGSSRPWPSMTRLMMGLSPWVAAFR